jgi:hypothetical protein
MTRVTLGSMDWKKWGRRIGSVAAAPMTGGLSLAGLAPDLPDGVTNRAKDLLLGQDPNNVKLPTDVEMAQQQRRDLISKLMGGQVRDEAQKAVAAEGRLASERASATAQSQAAGTRGFGALLARQAAQMANANAQAQIAGNQAVAAQQAAAQDVGAMQRDQALAAGLMGDAERSAMMAEEYRKANAKQGLLPMVMSGIGAAAGGYLGGPEGAKVGGQAGYYGSQPFMRS